MKRVALLALAIIFVLPSTVLNASGASTKADSAVDAVEVLIDSVKPVVPRAKSTLRIAGTISNGGDLPIEDPVVQLRLSPDPLNSRSEIPEVMEGTTQRRGVVIPNTQKALPASIQPGQSADFKAKVKLSDLALSTNGAVYAIFVEVVSGFTSRGWAATTVPWFPRSAEYEPSGLSLLWPITQRPSVASNALVIDPDLPGEFAAGGRLDDLLKAGSGAPVSWVVDTATLQTAATLADGYQVLTESGPESVDGSAEAQEFSARLEQELASKPVSIPGYAVVDADAMQRAGLSSFVVRSTSLPRVIGEAQLADANRSEVFLAPGGRVDDDTLRVLVDAGVRTVVVSDRAMPPTQTLNYTPTGAAVLGADDGEVEFLLTDRQLDREFSSDLATVEQRARAKQAILSDLAMITLERPSEPRNVVALPPVIWDPGAAWAGDIVADVVKAPWIKLVQPADVNTGPLVERAPPIYGRKARKSELPASYVERIAGLERRLDALTSVVDDPVGFGEDFATALQRSASGLWRDSAKERDAFLETISHQLDAEKQKVSVVSAGSVTLAGDNGILPLTIANELERDVTVGVELRTANQIRLLYDPPKPVAVKSSQKTGIEVPIRVVGSQPMEVSVVLTDAEGGFYDDSATLQLQSTASTRIAAVVAAVAASAFLVLVGIRLVRRRRHD